MSRLPSITGIVIAPLDWGWSVWPPRKEGDGHNVIPDDDTRMHINGPDCWCAPEEDECEADLWIHNADDARDTYMEGHRKLN